MATTTASTKRNPAASGGKIAAPAAYLTGLAILPLMPVDAKTAERYQLRSPRESKQTFVSGSPDIVEGDRLVIGATEYAVEAVGEWAGADADYVQVFVEEIK